CGAPVVPFANARVPGVGGLGGNHFLWLERSRHGSLLETHVRLRRTLRDVLPGGADFIFARALDLGIRGLLARLQVERTRGDAAHRAACLRVVVGGAALEAADSLFCGFGL